LIALHPFFNSIQLDRHHPSRCCTPFFVWRTLLRSLLSNIDFTIQPPTDTTTATTVSPSLQAFRQKAPEKKMASTAANAMRRSSNNLFRTGTIEEPI
jgi:hypothetical protein